eukprot:5201085-Pyramimonas_sp.AAC.1
MASLGAGRLRRRERLRKVSALAVRCANNATHVSRRRSQRNNRWPNGLPNTFRTRLCLSLRRQTLAQGE